MCLCSLSIGQCRPEFSSFFAHFYGRKFAGRQSCAFSQHKNLFFKSHFDKTSFSVYILLLPLFLKLKTVSKIILTKTMILSVLASKDVFFFETNVMESISHLKELRRPPMDRNSLVGKCCCGLYHGVSGRCNFLLMSLIIMHRFCEINTLDITSYMYSSLQFVTPNGVADSP